MKTFIFYTLSIMLSGVIVADAGFLSPDINNDCIVNDLDLAEMAQQWLKEPGPLGVNLLVNPGFEDQLNYWITDNGAIRNGDPSPHSGSNYLFGAKNGASKSHTYQQIDLLAVGFDTHQLDNELLTVSYGGYQAGWHTQIDQGLISIEFLDGDMEIIEAGNLGWHWSNNTWILVEETVAIPIGTRHIIYTFDAQRYEGSNNDAYLDDAFVLVYQTNGVVFTADLNQDNIVNIFDFAILASQWLSVPTECQFDLTVSYDRNAEGFMP